MEKEEGGPSIVKMGSIKEKQEKEKDVNEDQFSSNEVTTHNNNNNGGGDEDYEDVGDGRIGVGSGSFVLGPLVSLKEQLEKDKDDDSLRRWKEKLLGQMEPEVKFHSIGIISDDFIGEIIATATLPVDQNQSERVLFTLGEGPRYQLKLTFTVLHNIVSGLTYTNTVWKGGVQVDQSKGMLGTFAPQKEPYVHTLEEETTPSGILARGICSAKLKGQRNSRILDF